MTILLTIYEAGSNISVFDLYSDLDNYTNAFETGVSKSSLLAGYTTSLCPDYANNVRVQATDDCVNYIDIVLSNIP